MCVGHTDPSPSAIDEIEADNNIPVHDVTECDAWLYCRWAGKRLCGAIGDGGPIGSSMPMQTEWVYACMNGPMSIPFPYGDQYDPSACNTESDAAVPVGSKLGCHGPMPPFNEIYDLVGNTWEFVNQFDPGFTGARPQGGAWASGDGGCTFVGPAFDGVGGHFPGSGFRCCADP